MYWKKFNNFHRNNILVKIKVISLIFVLLASKICHAFSDISDTENYIFSLAKEVKEKKYINGGKFLPYGDMLVLAKEGDQAAQIIVAYLLYKGEGVQRNLNKSFGWLKIIADDGNASMQNHIGELYEQGIMIEKDLRLAAKYFSLAAEKGNDDAQYKLGMWYLSGKYYGKDIKAAKKWFIRSASQNNALAVNQLIKVFYDEHNYQELLKWVRKGVSLQIPNSLYVMSVFYRNGFSSVEVNIANANELLVKSAELGYAKAQYQLGIYYKEGVFFEKILERAFFWFTKSANQGYADSKLEIGLMYFDGEYLKQDYKKAILLFEEAASQENVDAYGLLAMAYIDPELEIHDIEKAKYWMKKAADAGHPVAKKLVKEYE